MRFLSTILTATLASSLTSASALPPVDHSDTSVNLETKPALSAWLYGLLIPGERQDNGAYCRAGSNCKSSFCMGQRCATNQCKTTEDCGRGYVYSHNNKCIDANLHDNKNCEQDEQCRSGKCENGKCAAGTGYYSARCSTARECNDGLICRQAAYLGEGQRACLNPDSSGSGQDEGVLCERNSDCKRGLECKDNSAGLEKIVGVFGGFGRQQDPRDRFQCTKPAEEQCMPNKRQCMPNKGQCFVDSECCSKNCKTTEIFFVRQCEA